MKSKILIPFILLNFLFIFHTEGQNKAYDISELNKIVENAFETFQPTGLSVAIVKNDTAILQKSFGKQSSKTGKPVTNSSLFNIASCTKPFTSTAMGLLVQQGKINWDDKVTDYIPGLKLKDPYITSKLTIADILSHRSGLSTFTGDLLWYNTDYSNEEIIHRMRHLPIENDFRAEFGYQNNMFMIAGEIIERVSGMTWSEFVSKKIFDPLQMHSSKPSNDELTENDQLAYPHLKGKQVALHNFHGTKPAASIMSNIKDLSNWTRMLLNNGVFEGDTIISQAILQDCFTPKTNLSVSNDNNRTHFRAYGLGWQVFDYHGKKIIEHNGGMPGYISKTTIIPEENLGVVVLNNGFEVFVHRALLYQLLEHFIQPEEEKDWIEEYNKSKTSYQERKEKQKKQRLKQRIENTSPSLELTKYTGKFRDKIYGDATIEMAENTLNLTLEPADEVFTSKMKHWHYDTFRVDFKDPFLPFGLITLDLNSKGEVEGFKIDLPSNDFHFNNLDFERVSE